MKYDENELYEALQKSVHLQSHYANLLNMYDGGKRMVFPSARAWIERLRDQKQKIRRLGFERGREAR